MDFVKHLFFVISVTFAWYTSVAASAVASGNGNWKNFNFSEPKENSLLTTENAILISSKGEKENRRLDLNITGAHVNDGKIAEQKDVGNGIKSPEMKFEIVERNPLPPNMISGKENQNQSFTREIRSDDVNAKNATELKKKIRTPVKLNMKQGLIMNQILSTYGLNDVNSTLCRDHVNEFKLGLRALEPWALKMFDASSKLMSGILGGNIAELGAWKECLNINEETVHGTIKGRHCVLYIHPTDDLLKIILNFRKKKISETHYQNLKRNVLEGIKLMWSVCVPDSCSHEDVLRHFEKIFLEVTEGLNLTLSLAEKHCVSKDDLPKLTKGDYIYLFCVSSVVIVVLLCSIIDAFSGDETRQLIGLFSLKRNAALLFSTSKHLNDISCFHGIRFLTMYLIVYGHRFIHNMATPVVNYLDLIDWLESYYSTTIHGGTLTVDTFILVASSLVSYTFFNLHSKGIRFNILLFYLNRHLRLLVPLVLAIGTYTTIIKHFGDGPLYGDLITAYQNACGTYWWSTLLYIQPFINPRQMCVVQTWFMSLDMFWYYFSPLLLLAVIKSPFIGYALMMVIYVTCTIINFYVAWVHKFNGQMPVSPELLTSDYFVLHYTQPLVRGNIYIMGLAFGHALFKAKDIKISMSPITKTVGWIFFSIFLPFTVLISCRFRHEDFIYSRLYASLFLSTHRTLWTLCIMWVVWCCQTGNGGLVNTFLSLSMFKIMGRLCYNVYLFHYLFQSLLQNSKKTPLYFNNFLSTMDSVGDMVMMLLLAIPLTLCFEYPFNRMCGLLFKPGGTKNRTTVKPIEKT
ncbi:hypothetical protein ABEB36_006054 [Hypothenemus hampei]|uniref:Nose resistant-to-fluoxetine protein N-terminal domain-containing protein n=1 Tax=Hypothenemus hampei TaxID=57062 RepID=A0ABD1F0E0_HYPHA